MAQYKVTAPDGGSYQVNAPDNATPDQIKSYVQSNYKTAAAPVEKQDNKNNEEFGSMSSLYKTLTGTPHEMKPMTAENIGQAARKGIIKATQETYPLLIGEGLGKVVEPFTKSIKDSSMVKKMLDNRPTLQEAAKPAGELTSKDLKKFSGTQYDKIPQGSTRYKPEYMESVRKDLFPKAPKTPAEKISYAESPAVKFMSKYNSVFKEQMSINDFEILDKDLTQQINANYKNGLSSDGNELYDLQTKLRDKILNPANDAISGGAEDVKTYRRALKSYSDAKRLEDIENIFKTSTTSNNPAQALRTGFKQLYNNPKRLRGYNEQQIKLIKQAANSDMTIEQLRAFGSRLVSIMSVGTGHPIGSVVSPALSGVARSAETALQAKRAQGLINSIIDPYKNPMSNLTKGLDNAQK